MREVHMKRATFIIAAVLAVALAGGVQAGQEKVTLCHAAGLDGTTHYITLTVGWPAAYGPAGHFYENGTPRAGHEEDYLGPCETPTVSPSPSASVEPSASPSIEPTPSPSVSPAPTSEPSSTPTPSPTPEPSVEPSTAPTPQPSAEPSASLAPSLSPQPTPPPTDTEPSSGTSRLSLLALSAAVVLLSLSVAAHEYRHSRRK